MNKLALDRLGYRGMQLFLGSEYREMFVLVNYTGECSSVRSITVGAGYGLWSFEQICRIVSVSGT